MPEYGLSLIRLSTESQDVTRGSMSEISSLGNRILLEGNYI